MSAKDLDFGLAFFYRIVMPGVILAFVGSPLASRYLASFGLAALDVQTWITALLALLIGVVLSSLDDSIYRVFEGRTGWPSRVSDYFVKKWQEHVRRLIADADRAKAA